MLSSRDPLQFQGHMQIEIEGMEENTPCIWNQKKSGAAIFFSDTINLKIKNIIKDKVITK